MAQIKFKDQVLNQMITRELLLQKAAALGLTVSKEELAREIHLIPVQNDGKIFDPDKYQSVLKANRLTPGQFESDFMRNLAMDKIQELHRPARPSQRGPGAGLLRLRARHDFHLLSALSWKAHEAAINATEAKVAEYYAAHKAQYATPAQARISFLVLSPETLANVDVVTDNEADTYYAEHKENFKIEEQINARHILVRVEANATAADEQKATAKIQAAQAELVAGKKSEDVAAAYTEDLVRNRHGRSLGLVRTRTHGQALRGCGLCHVQGRGQRPHPDRLWISSDQGRGRQARC